MEYDRRLRERVEASLAKHLREQPGVIGRFQDEGVRYRERSDKEEPIKAQFQSTVNLLGVPEMLWI